MKAPGRENPQVPGEKVVAYLLSDTHPSGHAKARFFRRFGFSVDRWELLADALRRHVATHDVTKEEDSPFGRRYNVDGPLESPDGRNPIVRSVWFTESGSTQLRFVTAIPSRRKRS